MSADLLDALYYDLTHDTTVSGLVGTGVYPGGEVPTSASLPYLVMHQITDLHVRHQAGGGPAARTRMQIDALAESARACAVLSAAVRVALDNYRGAMGDPSDPLSVFGCYAEGESEEHENPKNGEQRGTFVRSQDFEIWHEEAATP